MVLSISLEILAIIIIIELILIFILIISTIGLKYRASHKTSKLKTRRTNLQKYLTKLMKNQAKYDPKTLAKNKWNHLNVMMTVLSQMNNSNENHRNWQELNAELSNSSILLARKQYKSRTWLDRFLSAEALTNSNAKEDDSRILSLVKDDVNLVFVHAMNGAIHLKSEAAINEIITRLAAMNWLTQLFYLNAFKNSDEKIQKIVVKRLANEKNPLTRAVCYKILSECTPQQVNIDVDKDLNDKEFNLRLAAIKYLFHIDKTKAVRVALQKIHDEHWEVRLVIIHRLGAMRVRECIPELVKALQDKDWWVRISAAEALKEFGKKGENLIQQNAPELTNVPYKARDHIPHTVF